MTTRTILGLWVGVCVSTVGLWWGFGTAFLEELKTAQKLQRGVKTEMSNLWNQLDQHLLPLSQKLDEQAAVIARLEQQLATLQDTLPRTASQKGSSPP